MRICVCNEFVNSIKPNATMGGFVIWVGCLLSVARSLIEYCMMIIGVWKSCYGFMHIVAKVSIFLYM